MMKCLLSDPSPPVAEGYCRLEVAPTGRSSCKKCYSGIMQGTMRVVRKTHSSFHAGMDSSYYHMRCTLPRKGSAQIGIRKITQLRHWRMVPYDELLVMRKALGEKVDEKKEAAIRKENLTLHKVAQQLDDAGFSAPLLRAIFDLNGLNHDHLKKRRMQLIVADALIWGLPGTCPSCNNTTLLRLLDRASCYGYMSGYTACNWVGPIDKIKRYQFKLPTEAKFAKKFKLVTAVPGGIAVVEEKAHSREANRSTKTATGKQLRGKKGHTEKKTEITAAVMSSNTPLDNQRIVDDIIQKMDGKHINLKTLLKGHKILKQKNSQLMALLKAVGGSHLGKNLKAKTAILQELLLTRHPKISALFAAPSFAGAVATEAPLYSRSASVSHSKLPPSPAANVSNRTSQTATQYAMPTAPAEKNSPALMVDPFYVGERGGGSTIYVSDDQLTPYNAVLTQVDLHADLNKYYRMQVVQKSKSSYDFWMRWGQTGHESTARIRNTACHRHHSAEGAVKEFKKKFKAKTGNDWDRRHQFVKKPAKYVWVPLSRIDPNKAAKKATAKKRRNESSGSSVKKRKKKHKGTLHELVTDLIELIFDAKLASSTLKQFKMDDNFPLGTLEQEVLLQGLSTLKKIESHLYSMRASRTASTAGAQMAHTRLTALSAEFYTMFPSSHPGIVDSLDEVKEKTELLEILANLRVSQKLTDEAANLYSGLGTIEAQYKALGIGMKPVESSSASFKLVLDYMTNSRSPVHSHLRFSLEALFDLDTGKPQDPKFGTRRNRQLLWHGSRITNWCGILREGLRIAPPEAPVTGYMFGKGVYFANLVTKSGQYCCPSSENPYGCLLLCDVALGNMKKLYSADSSLTKAPRGYSSVKGVGKYFPEEKQCVSLSDGVQVPLGTVKQDEGIKTSLLHDEFIVYDTKKIRMRYLVRVKFDM